MAKYCTNCGKEIPDNIAFCTECGTPAPAPAPQAAPKQQEAPVSAPPPPAAPQPQPQAAPAAPVMSAVPQPVYVQNTVSSDQPPKGKYGVVGTGTYFGLMFLFAIPVIGWIICIIMAFASKNENKKHFAKAMMIWIIIGIVLSVVGYFVFRWLGGMITDYINTEFGGQFGDLQDMLEQFKQFENGGLMPPTN